jgi:hypothetical protein
MSDATNTDAHVTTDVNREVTLKTHSVEKKHGHDVTFTTDSTRDVQMSGEFDDRVMNLINGVLENRKEAEDYRANKRNFNRMLTLFGALVIGLIVTYALTTPGIVPPSLKFLAPYTFVITIVLDSGLALYGYIRKY